jgi:hypothetical protein
VRHFIPRYFPANASSERAVGRFVHDICLQWLGGGEKAPQFRKTRSDKEKTKRAEGNTPDGRPPRGQPLAEPMQALAAVQNIVGAVFARREEVVD